jgi:thiosulfate dehydrogenase
MNPMTKKLMLADIPIDDSEINESVIPDNVERYDQPLRNESVDGSWETTWIRTYEDVDNSTSDDAANQSSVTAQDAVTTAFATEQSTSETAG